MIILLPYGYHTDSIDITRYMKLIEGYNCEIQCTEGKSNRQYHQIICAQFLRH